MLLSKCSPFHKLGAWLDDYITRSPSHNTLFWVCSKTPRAWCPVFQMLLLLLPLHIQEMSPWMEGITSPSWHGDHFQNCSVMMPFSTSRYCSDSILLSIYLAESLPAFPSSRFFSCLPFYLLISCLFFYIYYNVCLLFMVFFLHTFNLSVMF